MAEDETGAAPKVDTSIRAKTPSDFLQSIKGKPVLVKLNSGVDYRGACVPACHPPSLRHGSAVFHAQALRMASPCASPLS